MSEPLHGVKPNPGGGHRSACDVSHAEALAGVDAAIAPTTDAITCDDCHRLGAVGHVQFMASEEAR